MFTDARIAELAELRCAGWARLRLAPSLRSHDPAYMRFNQVIFLRFLEAGLAYRKKAPVNWCPGCETVLANEQVRADGTCERSGDLVIKRDLEQWFFRITAYADELLAALDGLDWPERVKTMQRNWIGRSEGAQFEMAVAGSTERIEVFTTRPDTAFGMTFVVLAPEHPLVGVIVTPSAGTRSMAFVERVRLEPEYRAPVDRGPMDKRGIFTGAYAINPFNGKEVPIYLADYVLMSYGTGAIMAVPAEDQRDWDFATAYGLPIVRTVQPPEGWEGEAYTGDGPRINSEWLDGIVDTAEAKAKAIDWLEEKGIGKRTVQYRLRDWLAVAPAVLGLPDTCRLLPRPRHRPRAGGPSCPCCCPTTSSSCPRASHRCATTRRSCWTTCPICGGPAERETDTMDTFVDSSWYFLRFCDPWDDRRPDRRQAPPSAGCRSTSTSAASSTPSCTCSTPASTPGPWATWACRPRS